MADENRKKIRRLRNLKLDRVDLVRRGAHSGAVIALAKDDEPEPVSKAQKLRGEASEQIAKAEDRSLSMDERRTAHANAESLRLQSRNTQTRPEPIGKLIRKSRTEQGMTQAQLAAAAQVSQPSIAHIESGVTSSPNLATFSALYSALGLTVAEVEKAGILR